MIDDFETIFSGVKTKKNSGPPSFGPKMKKIIMDLKKNKLWTKNDQIAVIACTNKPYDATLKDMKKIHIINYLFNSFRLRLDCDGIFCFDSSCLLAIGSFTGLGLSINGFGASRLFGGNWLRLLKDEQKPFLITLNPFKKGILKKFAKKS